MIGLLQIAVFSSIILSRYVASLCLISISTKHFSVRELELDIVYALTNGALWVLMSDSIIIFYCVVSCFKLVLCPLFGLYMVMGCKKQKNMERSINWFSNSIPGNFRKWSTLLVLFMQIESSWCWFETFTNLQSFQCWPPPYTLFILFRRHYSLCTCIISAEIMNINSPSVNEGNMLELLSVPLLFLEFVHG